MKNLNMILLLPALLAVSSCNGQIKNAHTVTIKVDGDCPMCEKTIESAAHVKGEAQADWDVDRKIATITYDSTRTDLDPILQRIAHAGYDNERYLAPQKAYDALPSCCQYERTLKTAPIPVDQAVHDHASTPAGETDHNDHAQTAQKQDNMDQDTAAPLAPVYAAYFDLKDALVATDAASAASAAKELQQAIGAVPMAGLEHNAHLVWMKVMEPLTKNAGAIAASNDVEAQRKAFKELNSLMIDLAKADPTSDTVFLQHCPMYEGGADWLSREKEVRNPYYGSKMLTCGSVKGTIGE